MWASSFSLEPHQECSMSRVNEYDKLWSPNYECLSFGEHLIKFEHYKQDWYGSATHRWRNYPNFVFSHRLFFLDIS